jgi:hypothetical protein
MILSSPDAGPYSPISKILGIPAVELPVKSGLDKALVDDDSIV